LTQLVMTERDRPEHLVGLRVNDRHRVRCLIGRVHTIARRNPLRSRESRGLQRLMSSERSRVRSPRDEGYRRSNGPGCQEGNGRTSPTS
jgi:hypothetical protein